MRASAWRRVRIGRPGVGGLARVACGNRAYVYGARYLEHMAGVHGEESLGGFARSVAGLWVPYRITTPRATPSGSAYGRAGRPGART